VFFTGFDRWPAAIIRVGDASNVVRLVTLARETGAELAVIPRTAICPNQERKARDYARRLQ
jgi:hypothetical protein